MIQMHISNCPICLAVQISSNATLQAVHMGASSSV